MGAVEDLKAEKIFYMLTEVHFEKRLTCCVEGYRIYWRFLVVGPLEVCIIKLGSVDLFLVYMHRKQLKNISASIYLAGKEVIFERRPYLDFVDIFKLGQPLSW